MAEIKAKCQQLTLLPFSDHVWKVYEVPGNDSMLLVNGSRVRGATHFYHQSIYIDEGILPDDKRRVLMHELAHAFIYITQLDYKDKYSEENLCDFVAMYGDYIHRLADLYFDS